MNSHIQPVQISKKNIGVVGQQLENIAVKHVDKKKLKKKRI